MTTFEQRPPADVAAAGAQLRRWRTGRLLAAGFERPLAERVAADARFDLHALIELTERQCPPELACRILAPLERSW